MFTAALLPLLLFSLLSFIPMAEGLIPDFDAPDDEPDPDPPETGRIVGDDAPDESDAKDDTPDDPAPVARRKTFPKTPQ